MFRNNFRKVPKTFEKDPKIRRCFDHTPTYLRVKHDISEVIDIFTIEDMENTPPEVRNWFRKNFTSGVF